MNNCTMCDRPTRDGKDFCDLCVAVFGKRRCEKCEKPAVKNRRYCNVCFFKIKKRREAVQMILYQIMGGVVLFLSLTFFSTKFFYKIKDKWKDHRIEKLSEELSECYEIKNKQTIKEKRAKCLENAKGKLRKIKRCNKKYPPES